MTSEIWTIRFSDRRSFFLAK